jgi:hypothetical protein
MTETQRVKKVINWLVFMEYAENERELAEKLGYTKSSFSQIVNGKVPLSERFVQNVKLNHYIAVFERVVLLCKICEQQTSNRIESLAIESGCIRG